LLAAATLAPTTRALNSSTVIGVRLRRLQLRAFGNKVVLHVDDDHDCRSWVDFVYAVGHCKPLF
jgi:hypothetical protein